MDRSLEATSGGANLFDLGFSMMLGVSLNR